MQVCHKQKQFPISLFQAMNRKQKLLGMKQLHEVLGMHKYSFFQTV